LGHEKHAQVGADRGIQNGSLGDIAPASQFHKQNPDPQPQASAPGAQVARRLSELPAIDEPIHDRGRFRRQFHGPDYSRLSHLHHRSRMNPLLRKPISVLVVEDSVVVRARLRALLAEERAIHVVAEAGDVEEAIKQFSLLVPDAVVLDLQLRQGSGLDVVRHIRRAGSQCVVIMLTNYAHPDFREVCQRHGADFFFHKATEFERVAEVLAACAATESSDSSPGCSNS